MREEWKSLQRAAAVAAGTRVPGYPGASEQQQFARSMGSERQKHVLLVPGLPAWLWISSFLLAAAGLFTANPVMTACAILAVPILTSMLWLQGEPPVLLFACLMQW